MAARLALGLIDFFFGAAQALALVREGLISLRAARGHAGSVLSLKLECPSMRILLLRRARCLVASGGRLMRSLRIPPTAGAYVLASFKRFGRLPPAPTFPGLTSLVLDCCI